MQISPISNSYGRPELRGLLGLQGDARAAEDGQKAPTEAFRERPAGPPPGPPPPRPTDGASDRFAADTLSSLLDTQAQARPSASDVAAELIGEADSDGDGALSADEIAAAISDAGGMSDSETVATAMSALDTDGDGFLSAEELAAAIEQSFAERASNAYRQVQGWGDQAEAAEAA